MRKFKEVLRLKYDHHLTNRKIAKSCAMSHVTVGKYLDLAEQAGIAWPLPDDIDDSQIEQRRGKRYTLQRLEMACKRAVSIGAYTIKNVELILKRVAGRSSVNLLNHHCHPGSG